MEQRKLRKVSVAEAESQDIWFRVTFRNDRLGLQTALGAWSIPFATIADKITYWGGSASIIGGVLWMFLFSLFLLDELISYSATKDIWLIQVWGLIDQALSNRDIRLPAAPTFLFLIGLLGLRARYWKFFGSVGRVGLSLTFVGLALATWLILIGYRPWHGDLLTNEWYVFDDRMFGSLLYIVSWYGSAQPGLVLMSVGLVLATASIFRASTPLIRPILLMTVSVLLMHVVRWLDADDAWSYGWQLEGIVFTALALGFGAGWLWLGRMLRAEGHARAESRRLDFGKQTL